MIQEIKKVAVIGAGTMGASIAAAVASANIACVLKDVDEKTVFGGLTKIDRIFESKVKKGLSVEEAQLKRALITASCDPKSLKDVDLVIEAVPEVLEIKRAVLTELDRELPEQAIIATNTSSLSITQLASFTKRPNKVIGLHFFNPAHLMKLVEVIPALQTDEQTIETCLAFAESLGKLSVRVEECASFLVNRLLGRYMNEALWCLQEGVATAEQIDQAAVDYVVPIGPLALRDMNGADIGLAVAQFNFQEYGERFRPAPIIEAMVERKILGQKTQAGFYLYDPETRKKTGINPQIQELVAELNKNPNKPAKEKSTQDFSAERLFLPMINEAFLALQESICKVEDLDKALMAGLGMRKGPLALAEDMGLAQCLEKLEANFKTHGERFRPAPLLKRYVWAGKAKIN
jgi:3-hydroxyacyl-CoA dehydrogenase